MMMIKGKGQWNSGTNEKGDRHDLNVSGKEERINSGWKSTEIMKSKNVQEGCDGSDDKGIINK